MKRADNLFEQITDLENLKLAYLKALKGKRLPQNLSKLRRVQPWQLIFDNGNWNLHGYPARVAQKSIWGENQSIEKDKKHPGPKNDGIILSFRSNQREAIWTWVWQWADEAWPLEPKELVENWLERREKVNKL